MTKDLGSEQTMYRKAIRHCRTCAEERFGDDKHQRGAITLMALIGKEG